MSLTIVTHHLPNHQELADITVASKQEYADRHGYKLHTQVGNYSPLSFDYQRIQIIYDLLFKSESPPDLVWWLGCDTLVMNHTVKVESLLVPDDKSLYIHMDVNGLNNDSFVMRKTDWTKRWLTMTLALEPQYRADCWQSQRCWQQQLTRNELGGTPWREQIAILSHPAINSYDYSRYNWPDSTPGNFKCKSDLILHLPGMNLQQRLDIFRSKEIQDCIVR